MEVFFFCRTSSRPSGSVPSAPSTSLSRKLLWEFRFLDLLLLLLPPFRWAGEEGGVSGCT